MRGTLIAPMALLLVAGCTPTLADRQRMAESEARTQARLEKALAGLTPGKPQTCIQPDLAHNSDTYGNTLLYRVSGRLIYRNDTNGGCFDRGSNDIIVTKSYTGQLCRGDIVRTIDRTSHMPSGSCSFGDFIPYRK